jgi:hypothetical protein
MRTSRCERLTHIKVWTGAAKEENRQSSGHKYGQALN